MNPPKKAYDPDRLWLNKGGTFTVANCPIGLPLLNRQRFGWYLNILPDGKYEVVHDDEQLAAIVAPEVLVQTDTVVLSEKNEEGQFVKSVRETWGEIVKQVRLRSEFLFEFTKVSRAFEMFLAATYRMDGFDEVILTPQSMDRGRDVIALKQGKQRARILDQAKAYRATNLVTHEEVRAMIGVMAIDQSACNGAITTTSDFAPTIYSGNEFQAFVPSKLELRNGSRLRDWLISLTDQKALSPCDSPEI